MFFSGPNKSQMLSLPLPPRGAGLVFCEMYEDEKYFFCENFIFGSIIFVLLQNQMYEIL